MVSEIFGSMVVFYISFIRKSRTVEKHTCLYYGVDYRLIEALCTGSRIFEVRYGQIGYGMVALIRED